MYIDETSNGVLIRNVSFVPLLKIKLFPLSIFIKWMQFEKTTFL
jgi:hypothetical protein